MLFFIAMTTGMPMMDDSSDDINERKFSALENMRREHEKIMQDSETMPFTSLDLNTFGAAIDEYIALLNAQMRNYGLRP